MRADDANALKLNQSKAISCFQKPKSVNGNPRSFCVIRLTEKFRLFVQIRASQQCKLQFLWFLIFHVFSNPIRFCLKFQTQISSLAQLQLTSGRCRRFCRSYCAGKNVAQPEAGYSPRSDNALLAAIVRSSLKFSK